MNLLSCQPIELFKQANHSLLQEQGKQTSPHYEICLPQPLIVHFIPEHDACVAIRDIHCPPPWTRSACDLKIAVYIIYPVRCSALAIPITTRIPLSLKVIKTITTYLVVTTIYLWF